MPRCCSWRPHILGSGRLDLGRCDPVRLLRVRHALDRARLLERADRPLAAALPQGCAGARSRPYAAAGDDSAPLRIKTAIFMTVRNEDPARAILRLRTVKAQRRCHRRRRRLQLFRAERHQRSGRRRRRGGRRRGLEGSRPAMPRAHRLPPPRRQHRLQGRQRARLLRALGQGLRADAAARRRQPDVGRADRAPGAHDAGPSQDRHPAEPRGRHALGQRASRASSSSACATACAPTPWARPGGSATAARSGATTRWCASSRSTSSASCRCCRASRRSAAMCCPTTRSRRP